jgi:YVTN family beta-propeller protein
LYIDSNVSYDACITSSLWSRAWADSVIKTITVGTGPYGDLFDPDNGYIYVANVFSNSVSVIDGSTNTVIATVNVQPNQVGQSARELAFDSNNDYIYVARRS